MILQNRLRIRRRRWQTGHSRWVVVIPEFLGRNRSGLAKLNLNYLLSSVNKQGITYFPGFWKVTMSVSKDLKLQLW